MRHSQSVAPFAGAALILMTSGATLAQDQKEATPLDGSAPFLCATGAAMICGDLAGCTNTHASLIGAPAFIEIDVPDNQIASWGPDRDILVSEVEHMETVDGNLILQGIDDGIDDLRDGIGWTISISQTTGRFSASAPTDDIAMVLFGSCTPL